MILYMKKILFTATWFICVSCSSAAQQKTIDANSFESEMKVADVQLLDVRTAGEYKNGHIKNALQADWTDKAEFEERTKYLDKTKPLLLYCASGVRSGQAATWLSEKGFTNVSNLNGGFIRWKQENKLFEATNAVKQITAVEYNEAIKNSGNALVLVDFGAAWCPPCKKMEPVITQLVNEETGNFALIKADADTHTDMMNILHINALPTFVLYKNGAEVWRKEGIATIEEFKKALLL